MENNLVELNGLEVEYSGKVIDGIKATWKNRYTVEEAGMAISQMLTSGQADKVLSVKPTKIYRYA